MGDGVVASEEALGDADKNVATANLEQNPFQPSECKTVVHSSEFGCFDDGGVARPKQVANEKTLGGV